MRPAFTASAPASRRLREVQVENRPQGVITLVTVAFPLGVSKPGDVAPTTKPLRARY
jgi:hypothetical protein